MKDGHLILSQFVHGLVSFYKFKWQVLVMTYYKKHASVLYILHIYLFIS